MKVLIICPFFSPNIGGVETHLDDLVSYLNSKDIKSYVVTYNPLTTKAKASFYEKRGSASIFRLPWPGNNIFHKLEPYLILELLYLTPALLFFSLFFLLFYSRKIDVIHSHGLNASFIGFVCGKIFRKRHITCIHAVYNLKRKGIKAYLFKSILNTVDNVLTLSDRSKKELLEIGIKKEKVGRFYYWVNQEIFNISNKDSAKRELGWEDEFVVLFVGRLIEIKGIDLFLDLAKSFKHNNMQFVAIGDGPLEEFLREQKIDNFFFLGKKANLEMPIYYKAADILCVPSKYEEGYGRVILEALSCGLPVVASNRGGIPEIIHEKVGILCLPNTEDFKKAIEKLINDENYRLNLSRNAFMFAKDKFSFNNAEVIFNSYKYD